MQGWKTLIFGALITALGGIQATDLAQVIPESFVGVALSAIGLVVMGLRAITKTPVMTSDQS